MCNLNATCSLSNFHFSDVGANSSTELYLTGALHPSGTFPTPSALSSYQHPSAFPTRSFTTTSAPAVQDSTFSSSNGLLSPNDPLLQLKSSQYTVPTALAFGGASLGAGLPPQSSTYRSAQESAPHLLQPQFSLLSASLGSSQQAPQPYGGPVFSGTIERALQRDVVWSSTTSGLLAPSQFRSSWLAVLSTPYRVTCKTRVMFHINRTLPRTHPYPVVLRATLRP